VLPLQLGVGGIYESPGEMISDYLEPAVDPAHSTESWRLMLELLHLQCSQASVPVVLHNLRADGPCRATLTAIAGQCGFAITDEPGANAGRIELPRSWDEYLGKLSGRDRKELKRKIKKATTEARARFEVVSSGPRLLEELQRALGFIEQAGGSKGFKARWTYRPIFKRAANELASNGQVQVQVLMLNDKPAASVIVFPSAGGPLLWAAGFDPETSKHSPGIVLFAMSIQHAIAQGAQYFDLLRGQSRYKDELGAVDYPLRKITLKVA
jgi:CelD/BcsL family acetyltransferase involved in cellulose biosynthesis